MTGRASWLARALLAIGVVIASLITLPYVLRAWPHLPWPWVRFAFVVAVIVLVIAADRLYVRQQRTGKDPG